LENLQHLNYFNYLGSIITNYARSTCEIKSRIVIAKVEFKRKKNLSTNNVELNLKKKKLAKFYNWSIAFYATET
jgi:hypothetical protein